AQRHQRGVRTSGTGFEAVRHRCAGALCALPAAEAGAHRRRREPVAAAHQARPGAAIPDRRSPVMTRKPAAFRIEPEADERPEPKSTAPAAPRKPRSVASVVVTPAEIDVFDAPDLVAAEPPPAAALRRRSWLGS